MRYEVVLKHWVDGSGFTHEETFDWLDSRCTAKDYINSLDPESALTVPEDGDTLVVIKHGNRIIDECWVSEA